MDIGTFLLCNSASVACFSERPVEVVALTTCPVPWSDLAKDMTVFDAKSSSLVDFLLSSSLIFGLLLSLDFIVSSEKMFWSTNWVLVNIEFFVASLADLSSLEVVV